MPNTTEPKRRLQPELQENRARQSLKMLMTGWEGALIGDGSIKASHRAAVRTATTSARRALERGTSAHTVVLEHLAPVFATEPGAQVTAAYGDEDAA